MDFLNNFVDDAKALNAKKRRVSPFLSALLYCFGRLGAGLLVSITLVCVACTTAVYFGFGQPTAMLYWHGIIIVVLSVLICGAIFLAVNSLYKKSRGKARLVLALQRVSDAIVFESSEIDKSVKKFDKASSDYDKAYALGYIYYTAEELLETIDAELKDFTALKDESTNREVYDLLVALAEKVEKYKAKCEANRQQYAESATRD